MGIFVIAARLTVDPGGVAALTDLGSLSAALPPAVAPELGFAGNIAPGWSFAQADFVEPGYRDPDPALPSLHGYDASLTEPPLAIGTFAAVVAVAPRLPGPGEMIVNLDIARGGLDAAALGVFDVASAQILTDHSITISAGDSGRRLSFKFAGQVGSSNDE